LLTINFTSTYNVHINYIVNSVNTSKIWNLSKQDLRFIKTYNIAVSYGNKKHCLWQSSGRNAIHLSRERLVSRRIKQKTKSSRYIDSILKTELNSVFRNIPIEDVNFKISKFHFLLWLLWLWLRWSGFFFRRTLKLKHIKQSSTPFRFRKLILNV